VYIVVVVVVVVRVYFAFYSFIPRNSSLLVCHDLPKIEKKIG